MIEPCLSYKIVKAVEKHLMDFPAEIDFDAAQEAVEQVLKEHMPDTRELQETKT